MQNTVLMQEYCGFSCKDYGFILYFTLLINSLLKDLDKKICVCCISQYLCILRASLARAMRVANTSCPYSSLRPSCSRRYADVFCSKMCAGVFCSNRYTGVFCNRRCAGVFCN